MDTIVALSTPPGRGAIGVLRLSGPTAHAIVAGLSGRTTPFPDRRATRVRIAVAAGRASTQAIRDEALVTVFAGPRSYTGEDMAEVACHGSPVVLEGVLLAAVDRGARLAGPGEFTLRAFLNGRLDLTQAEAVADLVNAVTPQQAQIAFAQLDGSVTATIEAIDRELFDLVARLEASLDFPDEGYHFVESGTVAAGLGRVSARIDGLLAQGARGRMLREGAVVSMAGRPNVGKSSLFNALLQADRAIVSAIPGTTRDLLTERVDVAGIPVRLVDTAGLREARDEVEREGVSRARGAMASADLAMVVLDRSRPLTDEDEALLARSSSHRRLVVINKIDLPPAWTSDRVPGLAEIDAVCVSVKTGEGVDGLTARLGRALAGGPECVATTIVTNVRHLTLLEQARAAIGRASDAIYKSKGLISEEFVLVDLQEASTALEEITGRHSSEDLLAHIFEHFCIGK